MRAYVAVCGSGCQPWSTEAFGDVETVFDCTKIFRHVIFLNRIYLLFAAPQNPILLDAFLAVTSGRFLAKIEMAGYQHPKVGSDQPRYVEIETTNGNASSFIIRRNELDFSQELGEAFFLFQFRPSPTVYMLRGYLSKQLHLEPIDYRASFRRLVA
ncbi:hypothetical protein CBM2608_A10104 [Cupriavidus taiwanensis]|nr:hypothetical protein CBM2608_A10104 [Cupriavidus taiwanensis]